MDILEQFGGTDAILGSIKTYAGAAGRGIVKTVLELFYVMKEPTTPIADKALIGTALAYNVLPASMRPKNGLLNLVGTFVSITFAYNLVSKRVTPEISAKVLAQLEAWFGPETAQQQGPQQQVEQGKIGTYDENVQDSL